MSETRKIKIHAKRKIEVTELDALKHTNTTSELEDIIDYRRGRTNLVWSGPKWSKTAEIK